MRLKKPTGNTDIYLSEKDMKEFFNITQKHVPNLIENRFLKPKSCDGKIIYRFIELIRVSFCYKIDE